ncbi:hypothetical protein [Dokdonella sp.]|uniref:hypothetical protein n=1 Tax=Dokdonella sp. TaxID=2291710 RepID=UPI003C60818F
MSFAGAMVVAAGLYLVALGLAAMVMPARAARFLNAFASSAPVHFLELFLRFAVAACFLLYSPALRFPALFETVGWVLLVTSAMLLVIPWRVHRRFAAWAVPRATKHVGVLGICSLLGGLFVLYSADWGRWLVDGLSS